MEMRGREGERGEQLGKKGGRKTRKIFARAQPQEGRREVREREGRCLTLVHPSQMSSDVPVSG